jgi:beta-lactamase regulating signal transducer with metallopeptidase domain
MDRLFLTILNMSLTGAFVIAAICLARMPLKKAPKIISYCLWAVAGFRLAVPFSIESVFSLIPRNIPEITAPPPVYANIPPLFVAGTEGGQWVLPTNPIHPEYVGSAWTLYEILAIIWVAVAALMLIYGVVSFLVLKRKMRGSVHIEANIYESETIQSPLDVRLLMQKDVAALLQRQAGRQIDFRLEHAQHKRRFYGFRFVDVGLYVSRTPHFTFEDKE